MNEQRLEHAMADEEHAEYCRLINKKGRLTLELGAVNEQLQSLLDAVDRRIRDAAASA
jgi:hemerythrin